MTYKINIARTFTVSHMGGPALEFGPGILTVPDDMPQHLAERALRAGRATLVHEPEIKDEAVVDERPKAKRPPRNKARGPAPLNKGDQP